MNESLPSSLQQILQRELAPNERLVWQARPASFNRVLASSGTFLFGIPFFAFSVFWTWGATGGFENTRSANHSGFGWFGFLWGGMFVLVGASMLLSPLWAWWVARRTLYVITDRRALLIEAPFRRTIQSFADERLSTTVRRENGRGRGDIIFERHPAATKAGPSTGTSGSLVLPMQRALNSFSKRLTPTLTVPDYSPGGRRRR